MIMIQRYIRMCSVIMIRCYMITRSDRMFDNVPVLHKKVQYNYIPVLLEDIN